MSIAVGLWIIYKVNKKGLELKYNWIGLYFIIVPIIFWEWDLVLDLGGMSNVESTRLENRISSVAEILRMEVEMEDKGKSKTSLVSEDSINMTFGAYGRLPSDVLPFDIELEIDKHTLFRWKFVDGVKISFYANTEHMGEWDKLDTAERKELKEALIRKELDKVFGFAEESDKEGSRIDLITADEKNESICGWISNLFLKCIKK